MCVQAVHCQFRIIFSARYRRWDRYVLTMRQKSGSLSSISNFFWLMWSLVMEATTLADSFLRIWRLKRVKGERAGRERRERGKEGEGGMKGVREGERKGRKGGKEERREGDRKGERGGRKEGRRERDQERSWWQK